ncbi:RNA-directed DNA polymerase, eukaryota [Tanacetum coccineum]
MGDKRSFNSKEDLTQKISTSVFVTNFPDHCTARDLWNVCLAYGKVDNLERLIGVDTKSFAFVLKHVKPTASADLTPAIVLDDSCILEVKIFHVRNPEKNCVLSWFSELGPANNSFVSDVRVVWISIEGLPICGGIKMQKLCVVTKASTIINDNIKIIVKGKIYWIRIRELKAWTSDEESVGGEKNASIHDHDLDHVSYSSFMKENNEFEFNGNAHTQGVQSEDPFEIYDLLNKKETKEATKGDDPTYPPGFKPNDVIDKVEEDVANSVNQPDTNVYSFNNGVSSVKSRVNRSFSLKSGGSIMDVIENLVDIGQTMGYNMEGCLGQSTKKRWIRELNMKNKINFAAFQETKLESIDLFSIKELWGNFSFDFTFSPSVGFSGGILCVWDPNIFVKDNATISDSFVAVRGDFNEVRSEHERFGTIFNVSGAKAFNHFISTSGLIDLPLKGYSYTWSIKSTSKMSKLDRFLVSDGLLMLFPSLSALSLERHLSDHRPIIMREVVVDYGPSPFRVYHSWFTKDGFDKLVEDSWKTSSFADSSKITILRKKFQALKASIKAWCKDDKHRSSEYRLSIQSRISDLDKMFDSGHSNEELVNERTSLLKELHNINKCHSLDMAQKAKVRWSIEGDENSKFFHGIINMKRSQLAFRGVLIEGDWIDKPYKVKNEFLNHFFNRFARSTGPNIVLESNMFKQLSSEQIADLECDVTYDEIKRAVWDCGTNKSPGPDGFTFDFIRTYWKIINQDVVNAVREFFVTSKFPPGSNSSFIALIPKKQDAKLVKDFRPISLIGCFYKIIAKILANRLSMVISISICSQSSNS